MGVDAEEAGEDNAALQELFSTRARILTSGFTRRRDRQRGLGYRLRYDVVDTNFIARILASFAAVGIFTGKDSTGAQQETPTYTTAAATMAVHIPHAARGGEWILRIFNATLERPMDLIVGDNC